MKYFDIETSHRLEQAFVVIGPKIRTIPIHRNKRWRHRHYDSGIFIISINNSERWRWWHHLRFYCFPNLERIRNETRKANVEFHFCGLESERNKANKFPFRNIHIHMHDAGAKHQHMLQIFRVLLAHIHRTRAIWWRHFSPPIHEAEKKTSS